jgi:hypothetical protein
VRRVFKMTLNKNHTILPKIEVLSEVGVDTALEKFIFFGVYNQTLQFGAEQSKIIGEKVDIELHTIINYPLISSIALFKGDIGAIAKLARKNTTINPDFISQDYQFRCHELVKTTVWCENYIFSIVYYLIVALALVVIIVVMSVYLLTQ